MYLNSKCPKIQFLLVTCIDIVEDLLTYKIFYMLCEYHVHITGHSLLIGRRFLSSVIIINQ
jgi:hypothetical protein